MLDAKLYCVFFFWYFISCIREKLLYFALLWTASHGAFINLLLCQFTLFLSYLVFYQGEKQRHCQTSLLDIDWNIYSAHAFASLMYTNWLISNQKQSSTLYTWSAFVSQSVCAGAFGFIVVVNSFVVGLFLFLNLSLFVIVWKKCTCYGIIVNMKGCVKGPARFRRPHLKKQADFILSIFYCPTPRMPHNQVEMRHSDKTLVSDSGVLSLHAVFLSASVLLAWLWFIYIKGKWALQQ